MLLWVHVHPERRELGKERAFLFGQEAEAPVRSLGGGGVYTSAVWGSWGCHPNSLDWGKRCVRGEYDGDVSRDVVGCTTGRRVMAPTNFTSVGCILVRSSSLFSFMQKHRCRFYQDSGLEHPQLWITDASCRV